MAICDILSDETCHTTYMLPIQLEPYLFQISQIPGQSAHLRFIPAQSEIIDDPNQQGQTISLNVYCKV